MKPTSELREKGDPTADERRHGDRYPIEKPLVLIPVLANGTPDRHHCTSGTSRDLSDGGIGIAMEPDGGEPSLTYMVGLIDAQGTMGYEGVEIRHQETRMPQRSAGACFGGLGHEILERRNLLPVLDHDLLGLTYHFPPAVLDPWVEMGVLDTVWVDRIQLCPRCRSLPTLRPGCPDCGSARLVNDELIHHFACGFVGRARDFEIEEDLRCPKCRVRHLVVGADFETVTGPHRCLDCHWSGIEQVELGQCLRCGFRFPISAAHLEDLRGYDVHRLDPLALVSASG